MAVRTGIATRPNFGGMAVKRFDRVELGGAAVAGILIGLLVAQPSTTPVAVKADSLASRAISDEVGPLIEKYGPAPFSSHEEDLFIRDFFQDRRGGVFLDVGSGHYRNRSNTYYLESALGWSGIAVDAQAKYTADY